MPYINPRRLKHWRTTRNLSMEDLAARSAVNKSTIFRIENDASLTVKRRHSVLEQLARALNVPPEELALEADPSPAAPPRALPGRSQVTLKLTTSARNALSFVSCRYRVKPSTIMELAPLLFVMVAEDSLRRRAQALSALHAARVEFGAIPGHYGDGAERFEQDEAAAIRAKDLFGRRLDDPELQPEQLPEDMDMVGHWNPFAAHLKEWLARTGEEGGRLDWEYEPDYAVCHEVALQVAGGDEAMATALQDGWVGVHEIPAELRSAHMAEQRLAWLRERVSAVKSEREARDRAAEAEIRALFAKAGLVTGENA